MNRYATHKLNKRGIELEIIEADNKKAPQKYIVELFRICCLILVTSLDKSWNTILSSTHMLYVKLIKLGLELKQASSIFARIIKDWNQDD